MKISLPVRNFLAATSIGVASAALCWVFLHHFRLGGADFNWPYQAARRLLAGEAPYSHTPQGTIPYPLPAALPAIPLVVFPPEVAGAVFFGISSGLLALGLIRQESAFNENARSKANARGLMQILPSTGRKVARQIKITRYNSQKLFQAETNIILGTRYFAFFLQQYGKPELALAAYNAGDSRVKRWLKEWGDLDMAEFVEQIPFAETRGYVKQVLSNRARYDVLTSSAR